MPHAERVKHFAPMSFVMFVTCLRPSCISLCEMSAWSTLPPPPAIKGSAVLVSACTSPSSAVKQAKQASRAGKALAL
jgi:hypothetical protein